jgi:uncharacterized protein (DUF58 family)
MGFLILAIFIAAFSLGRLRGEPVLTLSGTVFLMAWAWCLLTVLCLSLPNRRRAAGFSVLISPQEIPAGSRVDPVFPAVPGGRRFFRLPGLLIRCKISLKTRDGRGVEHVFDPDLPDPAALSFPVPLRGAYYSDYDLIVIRDAPGFFEFAIPLSGDLFGFNTQSAAKRQDAKPRLLVSPARVEAPFPVIIPSGGAEHRTENPCRRTDDLTDHRPYVPGDDPRRINWKLYSHGTGLFVREGEPEPPPRSRLLILVDTETDPALYNPQAAREAVDMLCENALAAALECSAGGGDVFMGYSGGGILGGSAAGLASALALPASIPLFAENAAYPESDGACLILALPRTRGGDGSSGLDRFLRKGEAKGRTGILTGILFLYRGERPEGAAKTCAAVYGQKEGIHARAVRL